MTTPPPAPSGGTPSSDQAPSSSRGVPGAVIGGRYTLRDPIGSGGMGAVWRAHDDLLRRDVAIKEVLLPPGIPRDERTAMYERTLREARAAASLSHPSVVRVYDVITDNERPWIVMELLQARSLADMITQDGVLPPRAIAKIGLSVLGALEAAHSAGVLHRDVKPANVLICSDGRCILTDFGVARIMTDNAALTSPGMVLGSPQYISPERAMGAQFGPPSDLFSLGVTLYTAAEGKPPFDRGDPLATMHAVVYEDPEPPRHAGPLTPVLLGLLAKEPGQRWDVAHTRSQLRALLSGPLGAPGAAASGGGMAGPAPAHPVSGTPAGAPMSGPPTSGPPVPGPPVSGSPVPGAPLSAAPASGGPSSGPSTQPFGAAQSAQARSAQAQPTSAPPGTVQFGAAPPVSGGSAPGGPPQVQPPQPPTWSAQPPQSGTLRGTAPVPQPTQSVEQYYESGYPPARFSEQRRKLGPWLVGAGAAAVAILLVVIAVGAASGWFSGTPDGAGATPSTAAENTDNERTIHDAGDGYSASIPKDWTTVATKNFRQYADPNNRSAWIRFNSQRAGTSAARFLRGAAAGLRHNKRYRGFRQIALRTNVSLDGQHAAELEYRLVDTKTGEHRHAIWRVIVNHGRSHEVYMSVPEKLFAKEKPVYERAVKSYKLD